MSTKGIVLLDSFSWVKLIEGSTLFILSEISSVLMFRGRKISISSIYLKYVVLLGSLYLKGPDSKNSRNRKANTPLGGFPWGGHIFVC